MAVERLGANFGIDITNLQKGLNQANRLIRESESQFKAAASGMDDWTSSADGISDRLTHLNNVTALQRTKIDALKKSYQKLMDDGVDPNSRSAVELRTKINNETTALNKNEKEIKDQIQALNKLENGADDAGDEIDDLKESTEKSSGGFTVMKGAIANLISTGITTLVGALSNAVSSLFELSEATKEYRNEMNRLETSFTNAGLSASDAQKTYDELYSVLGDTGKASEAAGHLSLLAKNSEDLSKWTNIATGVYAQFGDSLPIEGLTEAANETAKVGDLTGVLADALNWAGVNEDDFQDKLDACSTEQERQKLITETLNGLYSDQADKFKELNKDIIDANNASNELAKAQAELGEAMQPLNTQIMELKTSLLNEFTPALKEIIEIGSDVLNGVEGAPERLANAVSSMLASLLEKSIEVLPQIVEFATQVVFMFAQTIIENLPEIVQTAMTMFTQFVNTLAQMAPSLVPTIIETVVLIAETLLDNIDMLVDAGVNLIMGLAEGLIEAIPFLISKIPEIITKLIVAIFNLRSKLTQAGMDLLIALAKGLIEAVPQLIRQIPAIIKAIVDGLKQGVSQMVSTGKELLKGLFEGMLDPSIIWEKVKQMGSSILDAAKSFFGIHSPSRLMRDEIGQYLGSGMALGIGDGFDSEINGVNKAIVKSLSDMPINNASGAQNGAIAQNRGSSVVINQNNTFAQAHSRYELFKTKQQTAAAVRLAMEG